MPVVGSKSFPYTKTGRRAAARAAKKEDGAKKLPKKPRDGFTSNPMSQFRGNKTALKRPSGRKR